MSNGTALTVIPADLQLPAHLQTPEAAAAIAAANAAAAGGIKSGSFPRISKKGSKFHIIDGDEVTTLMNPPSAPGQPALPMMLLPVVVISANPSVSKVLYIKDFNEGDAGHEPDCKSSDGVRPDASVAQPQHDNCAACPQNQWGSKISKMSGKETKACTDIKQVVVVPRSDLGYKALGFQITPSELKDWGAYVKALSARNIPVTAVQTNITFDLTATHPKCVFSFGGVLTAEEYAKVQERAQGDDVRAIVAPTFAPRVALPAPATQPAAAPQVPVQTPEATVVQTPPPVAPAAAPIVPLPAETPPAATGFPAATAEKRTRSPRKPPAEAVAATAAAAVAGAAQAQTIAAVAGAAAASTATDPFAGLPPHVKTACDAAGTPGTPGYAAVYQALAGKPYVGAVAPAVAPAPAAPIVMPPAAAPAPAFGGAPATPATPAAVAQQAAASVGQSLKDKLAAKLNGQRAAGA